MGLNVKIKIALSKDEVRILIKILVGDQWAFVFREGKMTIAHVIIIFESEDSKKKKKNIKLKKKKKKKFELSSPRVNFGGKQKVDLQNFVP